MLTAHGNTSTKRMPPQGTNTGWLIWLTVAQIITWLVIIFGWRVANASNNTREKRKELRAELDTIRIQLDELVDLAWVYYTSDLESTKRAAEILVRQTRLFTRVERLSKIDSTLCCVTDDLHDLMDGLTGDDFQSHDRVALAHDDSRLVTLTAKAEAVFNHLENEFRRIFPDSRVA